ncbi:MAG TPA: cache domain-containing protein [Geobacteraceae bacterium]
MLKNLLVAVVPVLLVSATALVFLYRDLEGDVVRENQALARSVAGEVEAGGVGVLNLLSHVGGVLERGSALHGRQVDLYLDAEVRANDLCEALLVLDKRGRVVHAGLAGFLKQRRGDYLSLGLTQQRICREAATTGIPRWSEPFVSPLSGEQTVAVAYPLTGGMVFGYLSLRELSKIPGRVKADGYEGVMIVDREGGIVAHHDPSRIGEVQRPPVLAPEGGIHGETEGEAVVRHDRRLGCVASIPENGWQVIVRQELRDSLAPFWRMAWITAAGLLLALTIAVSGTLAARTDAWQSSPLEASHGRDPGEADAPTVATIPDAE